MLTVLLHVEIILFINHALRVTNEAVCLQCFCVFEIRLYANIGTACYK